MIGLGNVWLRDEGIGVRIVEALRADPRLPAGTDVVDLGTGGLAVVHELAGRDRAIIVDCARMGSPPGTVRRFTPDHVRTRKVVPRLGASHGGDLLQMIRLSQDLGECPANVVLIGVEPAAIDPGETLTPTLQAAVPRGVEAVVHALGVP